jgi:hypothetical protein
MSNLLLVLPASSAELLVPLLGSYSSMLVIMRPAAVDGLAAAAAVLASIGPAVRETQDCQVGGSLQQQHVA